MNGIDLRSDTVTKPTPEMRRAMYEAEVGDDGLEGDPTTQGLQELAAERLGMDAGLFVSSGSMGNLVAALSHVGPGDAMLIGRRSHMSWSVDQAHGHQTYGQVAVRMADEQDGMLPLEDVELALKDEAESGGRMDLVCIENTHNATNGMPLELSYTHAVSETAKRHGAALHVDGARLFNAAEALDVPASRVVESADSVSFCLSKGLACPIGSILCGSEEFVVEARKQRKIVGGEMRQTGMMAAAGIVALESMIDRLAEDHENARRLADGLANIRGVGVDPDRVRTNIVFFDTVDMPVDEVVTALGDRGVHCFNIDGRIRMVTHYEISSKDVDAALGAVKQVMES